MPRTSTTPPSASEGAPSTGRATAAKASKEHAAPPADAKTTGRGTKAAKAPAASAKPAAAKPAPRAAKAAPAGRSAAGRVTAPATEGGVEGYAGDQAFLDQQRQALLDERATYVEQAQLLRAEAESLVQEMEPGDVQFDEESGEGGTTTVDRERDLALSAQALAAVEEIDAALEKIETGRYGICEGCGEPILRARLEAIPFARLCIACKSGGLSRR